MTLQEVLDAIKTYGSATIKNILVKHGVQEPLYGAKVGDLKILQKKIKKDQALAMELYETGVYEAMYLAGLVADGSLMTEKQLQYWVEHTKSSAISEYTVPWVTAEHPSAWKLGLKWIDAKDEMIACSGWNTLAGIVAMKPDEQLDIPQLQQLLKRVQTDIHKAPDKVRYTMNGFVIGVGTYVNALEKAAIDVARKIGIVSVDMGDTACKVPAAEDYIKAARGKPGGAKKKKTLKC